MMKNVLTPKMYLEETGDNKLGCTVVSSAEVFFGNHDIKEA